MSMHSKNKFLQSREEQSPNKRLKANISDLLLDGTIGGVRAASLFTDAQDAQAEGIDGPGWCISKPKCFERLAEKIDQELTMSTLVPS